MDNERKVGLGDMAGRHLAGDPRYQTTLVEVYSSSSDLEALGREFFAKVSKNLTVDTNHPLTFLIGKFADFDHWLSHEFQYVDENRKFICFSKVDKIRLPGVS